MTRHDPRVRLLHMRDYSREAVAMASTRTRADLDSDRMFALAAIRLVEVVGEAGAQLSSEEQALYPDLPWHDIVGMRNRLIHGYDHVNYNIVWKTITEEMPSLIVKLDAILGNDEPTETEGDINGWRV